MAKEITDFRTTQYLASGSKVYRMLYETSADQVKIGSSDVASRLKLLERSLNSNPTTRFVDTIAQRDALALLTPGDICHVADASDDAAVGSGAAVYIWLPAQAWKLYYKGDTPVSAENYSGAGLNVDASGQLALDVAGLCGTGLKAASGKFAADLSDAVTLADSTKAASAQAVKLAYDKALEVYEKAADAAASASEAKAQAQTAAASAASIGEASANAASALATANALSTTVSELSATVSTASASATEAKTLAGLANEATGAASTAATEARTLAGLAKDTANSASDTATAAKTTAEAAKSTADAASETATAAKAAADQASKDVLAMQSKWADVLSQILTAAQNISALEARVLALETA